MTSTASRRAPATARTPADPCMRFRLIPPYPGLLAWRDYLREKGWAGYR